LSNASRQPPPWKTSSIIPTRSAASQTRSTAIVSFCGRGVADPGLVKQRLMELYFAEGADLSDAKVLIQAAVDCGMDGDVVRPLLASDADVDRIESEANSAKEAGIDGVPCFIFGGSVIVTGAQSPEDLASAIERTAERQTRLRAEANRKTTIATHIRGARQRLGDVGCDN
jgi:hypothetical protein